jgi:hypothetical protein
MKKVPTKAQIKAKGEIDKDSFFLSFLFTYFFILLRNL